MFIVYAKLGASLALSLLALIVWSKRPTLESFFNRSQAPWLLVFWGVFRLVPFVTAYLLLDFAPQSDVPNYYYPIGLSARALEIPYRDVYNPYSPLYGFWMAIPLLFWDNTRAIVLFLTLVELLAVWLTYQTYEGVYTRGERLFRALFYTLLPVPFVMSVLSGQEDVALWLFALSAILALKRNDNPYLSGLLLALGILSTKAVFILIIIPFLLLTRRLVPFLAGLATLGIPAVLFLFLKTGFLFIEQPLEEGTYLKAPNWASMLHPWVGNWVNFESSVWNYAGLVICLLVGAWMLQGRGQRDFRHYFPLFYIAVFSTMTMVQKNAVANYAYLFMLPLVFQLIDFQNRNALLLLLAFNVLAAIHPSLWWRIGQPYYQSISEIWGRTDYALEYGIELFILGYLLYLVIKARNMLKSFPESQLNPSGLTDSVS
ncbi:hypothetical protein ACO2Q8_20040 [Larkinella sp. VNQ87]|uniref:hypothetical protein n=1 Tax=Larkinella sp. VNQ87 TaxID=3400921 RepID=UPI003BFB0717